MPNLIGHAHQVGTIVFERQDNPWAFKRLDSELKSGQENRIRFDPSIAPVLIEPAPNTDPASLPWLEDVQSMLQTASHIYLQRTEQLLRFRQAIYHVDQDKTLITIGSLGELQHFAAEHWSRVSHVYALRHDGFRFNIERAVTHDKDQGQSQDRMEILARLVFGPRDENLHLTFDATGSNAHVELISWRNTVDEGTVGRFAPAGHRISLNFTSFSQPFTFCDEYHPEFKSHWYLFAPKTVKQWIQRLKRKRATG